MATDAKSAVFRIVKDMVIPLLSVFRTACCGQENGSNFSLHSFMKNFFHNEFFLFTL